MNFLTQSLAFLCIASFAATANANCLTDITADAFQNFVTAMDSAEDDAAADFPALCLAAGGDIFAFSGTTTCGDEVDQHSNEPMCLPTSCTSNEADITLMIPMIIAEEGCTGSYTYDGLGDGTPDSLSCMLDLTEKIDPFTEFAVLYFKEAIKMGSDDCKPYLFDPNAGPIPEECLPDYTGLQPLCEDNAMDYFTMSFTVTCDDESSLDGQDIPQCYPSSCTSDEAALKAMLADRFGDESDTDSGPVCTNTFSFSGLDDPPTAPPAIKAPKAPKAPKSSKSPSSTKAPKAPKAPKATKAPKAASTKPPVAAPTATPPPPTSGVVSLEVSSAIASVVSALVWFAM
jgi:hypothetical protein